MDHVSFFSEATLIEIGVYLTLNRKTGLSKYVKSHIKLNCLSPTRIKESFTLNLLYCFNLTLVNFFKKYCYAVNSTIIHKMLKI